MANAMPLLTGRPERVSDGHYLLRIAPLAEPSLPGQFVNIRVSPRNDPLLRRPFSIFSHEDGVVSVVIKTVGTGTSMLSVREPGEIDVIGPLGKGFTLLRNARVLIAGGGVGNAPLHYLARALAGSGCDITYVYGARSSGLVYLADRFRVAARRFIIVTDDGTAGRKGRVTDAADEILGTERFDMIYTCGPALMMKSLVSRARDIPIEVSMENYFGCGIGLCSGCVIETGAGRKRACIDGPVMDGAGINWDMMPD